MKKPIKFSLICICISSNKTKRTARSEEFLRIANAKREFSVRFYGQAPDKARLTMFDMIYYNPVTNPMKNPAVKPTDSKDRRGSSVITNATSTSKIKERRASISSEGSHVSSVHSKATSSVGGSLKAEKETAMPVPQLKLGPNGEIILDEKSLVIETTGEKEARETLANADIVYDDEFSGSKFLNACIYTYLLIMHLSFNFKLLDFTNGIKEQKIGHQKKQYDFIVVCIPSVPIFP